MPVLRTSCSRKWSAVGNVVRRSLLRLYSSAAVLRRTRFCSRGKVEARQQRESIQIVVLGLPKTGKTSFCLKLCGFDISASKGVLGATKGLLRFSQVFKCRHSAATVVKYVDVGGEEPLTQHSPYTYARSHALILLLDPSNDESTHVLHFLTNHHHFLKKKPILVVASSKGGSSPVAMHEDMAAMLRLLRTSNPQIPMMVMGVELGTERKEIVKKVEAFVGMVLQKQAELTARIHDDLIALDTKESRPLLLSKLQALKRRRPHQRGAYSQGVGAPKIPTSKEALERSESDFFDAERKSGKTLGVEAMSEDEAHFGSREKEAVGSRSAWVRVEREMPLERTPAPSFVVCPTQRGCEEAEGGVEEAEPAQHGFTSRFKSDSMTTWRSGEAGRGGEGAEEKEWSGCEAGEAGGERAKGETRGATAAHRKKGKGEAPLLRKAQSSVDCSKEGGGTFPLRGYPALQNLTFIGAYEEEAHPFLSQKSWEWEEVEG